MSNEAARGLSPIGDCSAITPSFTSILMCLHWYRHEFDVAARKDLQL